MKQIFMKILKIKENIKELTIELITKAKLTTL